MSVCGCWAVAVASWLVADGGGRCLHYFHYGRAYGRPVFKVSTLCIAMRSLVVCMHLSAASSCMSQHRGLWAVYVEFLISRAGTPWASLAVREREEPEVHGWLAISAYFSLRWRCGEEEALRAFSQKQCSASPSLSSLNHHVAHLL